MTGRVAGRAMVYGLWSGVVALAEVEVGVAIGVGPLAHSLLGVALGMLLVFRTNASYDRYWEGRRRWSEIVAASRSLVRGWVSHGGTNRAFIPLVTAYVVAVANRLRPSGSDPILRPALAPPDACALDGASANPAALSLRMSNHLHARVRAGDLHPSLAAHLEACLAALTQHESACERIATSPMPRAYIVQIRRLLAVYVFTLPFALVADLGWFTVPATLVIAFGLLGIEAAGTEIEDPFGDDANDLPLADYCARVRRDTKLLTAP